MINGNLIGVIVIAVVVLAGVLRLITHKRKTKAGDKGKGGSITPRAGNFTIED